MNIMLQRDGCATIDTGRIKALTDGDLSFWSILPIEGVDINVDNGISHLGKNWNGETTCFDVWWSQVNSMIS